MDIMVNVKFREHVGSAGDSHVLLIAEVDDGRREVVMFNRSNFYELNRWIAEKRLIWRLKRQIQSIKL